MDCIQYGKTVVARLGDAVVPERREVSIGDWRPRIHHCHENVRTWCAKNPKHKHIRGYYVLDYTQRRYRRLLAHALVEFEDGRLVDITPHAATQDFSFVRHLGTQAEFDAMVRAMDTVNVPYDT